MWEILRPPVFMWLACMVIFIIVEIVTVGLASIWFAGGAFTALLAAVAGFSPVMQIILFFAVLFALIIFTRPFALKYVKPHNIKKL